MKPPLRTVLRTFLKHYEDYESRRKLNDDQYEYEFQQLKKLTEDLKEDPEYTCSIGLKDVNRPKNRYKDIVPYDKSRVVLTKCEGIPGSDFINASYVKGSTGAFAYIAAQGPLPNTIIDFWRMVWFCNVQVLVMTCNETEAGKVKCETYWPTQGQVKQFGDISVELIETCQVCPDIFRRTMLVKFHSEMRDVHQFQHSTWPDHGVPDTVHPILELVRWMRDCQASETVPIVVHCSAGCGRTGTLCAIDYVWACLRHGKLPEDFSLFNIAMDLRRQRIAMIQTKEQYILAHKAIATLFEQQLNVIDCHTYVNLDEDGEPLMWKELSKVKPYPPKGVRLSENNHSSPENSCVSQNFPARFPYMKEIGKDEEQSKFSNIKPAVNPPISMDSNSKISVYNRNADFSPNNQLSEQIAEDAIPFIDEDEVSVRPNCGRAYLDIPSCVSISKLINRFDPFSDKISADGSSPDGEDENKLPQPYNGGDGATGKCVKTTYATLPAGSSSKSLAGALKLRDSYPPATSGISTVPDDSISDAGYEVTKPNVARRPSILKLRSFFERSSLSPNKENSKRFLFRNNSHNVARAGSAPPSLNCMDKDSALERDSILRTVTRKFRSASVRTEREIQPKGSAQNKPGAMANLKESLSTLSRTVSFNLTKNFHSYSPTKFNLPVVEPSQDSYKVSEDFTMTVTPKLSDPPKTKTMWYDKSSLSRTISHMKPTEKVPERPKSREEMLKPSIPNKTAKLLPFISNLSKLHYKDSTTMWYNQTEGVDPKDEITNAAEDNKLQKKTSKGLPLFQSITPWKKSSSKTPLSSPEGGVDSDCLKSSKFYAQLKDVNKDSETLSASKEIIEKSSCPMPEEIIHLSPDTANKDNLNKTETIEVPVLEKISNEDTKVENVSVQSQVSNMPSETQITVNSVQDGPPAIPKKTAIGRNRSFEKHMIAQELDSLDSHFPFTPKDLTISSTLQSLEVKSGSGLSSPRSPKDNYINVNIKAQKNLEQIENALRNNPRGAIIDLTSRESYCMEEELDNALKQLPVSQNHVTTATNVENNSKKGTKFTGYEVIWPENELSKEMQGKELKSGFVQKANFDLNSKNYLLSSYSPPLRRSRCSTLSLTKSSSCSSIEWLEPSEVMAFNNNFKDSNLTPTKRLVNEAVVELNTLLDRLTTRTLNEDPPPCESTKDASGGKVNEVDKSKQPVNNCKQKAMVHAVTLKSKSNTTGTSHTEEEIIFHFPPPPTIPPPDDAQPSETFNVVRKNGALIVSEKEENSASCVLKCAAKSNIPVRNGTPNGPTPLPRKSKHCIRRSASYTNISLDSNTGYENVFSINDQMGLSHSNISSKPKPGASSHIVLKSRERKVLPDYVNIKTIPSFCSKERETEKTGLKNSELYISTEQSHSQQFMCDMSQSCPPSAFVDSSIYGRIHKNSSKQFVSQTKQQDDSVYVYADYHSPELKKKLPSKKAWKAPHPPKVIQSSESQPIQKLPSRKLERAPVPPVLQLQKTHSSSHVLKQKLPSYVNYPLPPALEDTCKLPALHENVLQSDLPKVSSSTTVMKPLDSHPVRGLSHSRSDASVFLALKERKSKSLNRGLQFSAAADSAIINKILSQKTKLDLEKSLYSEVDPAIMNKILSQKAKMNLEMSHQISSEVDAAIMNKILSQKESGSNSDADYERIFFDRPSKLHAVEDLIQKAKAMPVAPPRARRRNTTEIQPAKPVNKEAPSFSGNEIFHFPPKAAGQKSQQEHPPAIPVKTKESFELPETSGNSSTPSENSSEST